MTEHITRRVLFETDLLSVADVLCRHDVHAAGPEETNERHSFAIPSRGMYVKYQRGQVAIADPSRVIFFNAGEEYRVAHPIPHGDDNLTFAFATSTLIDVVGRYAERTNDRPDVPFPVSGGPITPRAIVAQHLLRREIHHSPRIAVEERALELLDDVVRSSLEARAAMRPPRRRYATDDWRERIEAAVVFLRTNSPRNVSLGEVAAHVNSSPFHLARMFRRHLGVSVRQYVLRLRLAMSLDPLAEGRVNIAGIALDLGFSSHSHFTTTFRRFFGVHPSRLRQLPARDHQKLVDRLGRIA